MPEGPEIRLAADRIARILVGREIVEVTFAPQSLRRFEKRLTSASVTAVDTRGKAMLTRFDNGLTLYSHNQLYGRWYTTRRPRFPDTSRQLRVALHTATHSALLYSASDIAVLTDSQLEQHPFLSRVGPDILDKMLTAQDVEQRLTSMRFNCRAAGNFYLDQAFLAGIGNYLRSEILWAAQVSPLSRPAQLDARALSRLARKTLTISRRSYRSRGVTASPEEARARKAQGLSYEQYRFQVYGREGLPCYRCGCSIERHDMASRGLFSCPTCQQ
jgi:endonuclease-8